MGLIECPPTVLGAAQAGDLDILDGELVVVGDLLIDADVLLGVDDNLLLGLHRDHLGVAVGLWGGQRGQRQDETPTKGTLSPACPSGASLDPDTDSREGQGPSRMEASVPQGKSNWSCWRRWLKGSSGPQSQLVRGELWATKPRPEPLGIMQVPS